MHTDNSIRDCWRVRLGLARLRLELDEAELLDRVHRFRARISTEQYKRAAESTSGAPAAARMSQTWTKRIGRSRVRP